MVRLVAINRPPALKTMAISSDAMVSTGSKAWSIGSRKPSIATKCVVQIAAPQAMAESRIHDRRASLESRPARSNRRMVMTALATQTMAATTTNE